MAFNNSSDRYNRAVEITRKLTGIQFIPSGYGPWEALVYVWGLFHECLQCDDILFATLHRIKWDAYPQLNAEPLSWAFNKGTPLEKDTAELMALFYEELTTPNAEGAIELHSLDAFKGRYHCLSNDDDSHIDYGPESRSQVHKDFLNCRFNHLVHSFDPAENSWAGYKRFEDLVHILLPSSIAWTTANWLDESFILQELDQAFGANYQKEPDALTYVTYLLAGVLDDGHISGPILTNLSELPYGLAKCIWPVDTPKQITKAYKAVLKVATRNEKRAMKRKSKKLDPYEFGYANVKETGIHQLVSDLISTGAINDPSLKTQVFEMQFTY